MALNPNYIHLNATGVELWDYPNLSPTSGEILLTGTDGTADFPSDFTAATAATYNTSSLPVVYQFNFYKNASNRDRAKVEITNIYNVTNTDIFINSKVAPNVVNNVANTSETHTSRANEGLEVKIIGTLANYDFTTVPTVNYTDLYGNSHTVTATVTTNGNTKTATAILDYVNFNTNIVVNGVYDVSTSTITVTTTETNCSVAGLPQTVYANSILNLTATAATDYEFTTAPTFNYTDNNNVAQSVNFTVAANGKTATLNLNLATLDFGTTTATITATAAAVVYPTITVTTTETNCSVSGLPQTVYTNSILNLTATAATDYEFTTAPTFNYTDSNNVAQSVNFTVAANGKTATLNLNLATLDFGTTTATITATAAAVVYPTITVNVSATNCSVSGLPNSVNTHTVLNLTATANSNYRFDGVAPQIYYIDRNGTYHPYNFTVAADMLTAAITLNLGQLDLTGVNTLYLTASANAYTPYIEKYGTINVYKVSLENLGDFAKQRFFVGTDENRSMVDLGTFVNSVKRLFYSVTATANDVIKCGNYNTQIAVNTPDNDEITLNCGYVDIPKHSNNSNDFNNEITAFLPFVGYVVIPSEFVGKRVNLEYVCNVITADAVAKLVCDNVVINFYQCAPSIDLVYRMTTAAPQYLTMQNAVAFSSEYLKGLTPFVKFKYYADANENIINADSKRAALSTFSGFCQFAEIENLSTVLPSEIKYEIIKQLENGVYL